MALLRFHPTDPPVRPPPRPARGPTPHVAPPWRSSNGALAVGVAAAVGTAVLAVSSRTRPRRSR